MADKVLNPFPGLRAFEEEEDILFFGREKQIDELLRKLRTSRFLAIIGSSGSGKSSLVKSGLLPSLHSGLMSGVSSQWHIALFRPGNDPIGKLSEALSQNGILRDGQSAEELETNRAINESILRRSSLGVIEAYKQSGIDKKNNLLILVDQFEELFRFSKYEKDAKEGKRDSIAFINMLLKAAEQKELPIYVVFTMRSDFLGDCTEFRGLPEAINEGQYLIPRMTREERREAITGPIAVGGATITPALLNRLLNDVGDNPDQLPILQHALMRTWDSWKSKKRPQEPIDIEDYEHIGTITEALSQHAEEAYSELSSEREQQICEKVFKELTDKGGMASGIRRPRLLSELAAAAGATNEEVIKVIEVFRKPGRGFLMPAAPTPLMANSIIDISHESLMRVWKRLITWLEEEEESANVYLHLCDAANLYETGKGGLWRDPELQIALKWKAEQNTNAAWAARYNPYYDKVIFFLEHSRQQRDLEIKHKEELQKQRLRNTRRFTVVVSVIALIAALTAIVAFKQTSVAEKAKVKADEARTAALFEKQKSETNRRIAESERKKADIEKINADSAKAKAIREEEIAVKQKGIAVRQTAVAMTAEEAARKSRDSAIESRMEAERNRLAAVKSKDTADLERLKAITQKNLADKLHRLADTKNDAHKVSIFVNDKQIKEGLELAKKAYLNNIKDTGDFQDNDIYSGLLLSWENTHTNGELSKTLSGAVRSMVGLPGTDLLFAGDETGNISTIQYKDGLFKDGTVANINIGNGLRDICVSPDREYLLAVQVNQGVLLKINSDRSLKIATVFPISGIGKHGLFLGGDNFLVQSANGVVRYEVKKANASDKYPVHALDTLNIDNCSAIAIATNGNIYVSSGRDVLEYKGWSSKTKEPARRISFPSNVTSIGLDPKGKYLAAGTYLGNVCLKTLANNKPPESKGLHPSSVNAVKFCHIAPGRLQLASASSDKQVKLTEVNDDNTLNMDDIITITEHRKWVYTLFYTPDGRSLFSGSADHLIKTWPTTMEGLYNALPKN